MLETATLEEVFGPIREHLESGGELVCSRSGREGVVNRARLLDTNPQGYARYAIFEEWGEAGLDNGVIVQGFFALLGQMGRYGNPEDWRPEGGEGR